MCGIVGAVAERNVGPILIEGLRRLEYRGYDSAGIAILDNNSAIQRVRTTGKVSVLGEAYDANPLLGHVGIAHTRWATHGEPSESNAHPHICNNTVALVHNGIIENHEELRKEQKSLEYKFTSETDTETIVHEVYHQLQNAENLLEAVQNTIPKLDGAYGVAVISTKNPDKMVVARSGSPLVIGLGIGENFIASDVFALLPVTQRFIFLEEGDIAEITINEINIYDVNGNRVDRAVQESELSAESAEKGHYRHYMLKEIYEQPRAIRDTLEGRIGNDHVLDNAFGPSAAALLDKVKAVQIIACGTSYHAGMVARYWFEKIARVPCFVEVASEYRYRDPVVSGDTLFVTISQSGETADTLAALTLAKERGFLGSLAICNVPESSLVRESDLALMTRAGPEIGVASTKAFTTQLTALMLLVVAIGRRHGLNDVDEKEIVHQLKLLPSKIEEVLTLDPEIEKIAERFGDKHHTLFLGRGTQYPVAMEGALKLKEISYIHAEAYPAGELKHGPLALVDSDMPVVSVAPNNELLEKLKSNLQEVRARGGQLIVFADANVKVEKEEGVDVFKVAPVENHIAPIVYTVPLQLLSYHVAVLKGTDVDQPRNLAKSVTVE